MSDVVVSGLFILGAALISGLLTILATRSTAQIDKLREDNATLKRKLVRSLQQIEAYHIVEDLYANNIAERDGAAARTVKIEFRNSAEGSQGCERPSMTAAEARKEIDSVS